MREWLSKLRARFGGRRNLDDELRKEIESHLDLDIQEQLARGVSPVEAGDKARRRFGNVSLVHEKARDAWLLGRWEILYRDFAYALRLLVRNPGFAAVAVATLALGIGVNSAVFSVVNGVLLNPLPYGTPERLMWGTGRAPNGFTGAAVSAPDFLDYRDQNRTFEHFAAFFVLGAASQSWSVNGNSRQLKGAMITADFFETLGYSPVIGRSFTGTDEQTQSPQAVILSHHLWQEMFAASPAVVGVSAKLDGNPVTIVGVMPSSLDFPATVDFWYPTPMQAPGLQRRMGHMFFALGRLRPGVTQVEAQTDLDNIALRLSAQFPETDKDLGIHLQTMQEAIVGSSRPALVMLLGTVGFVLLIACANLGNLLLARYGARQHEISIRTAIGARRFRILLQFTIENLLLAMIAGGLALLLAYLGIDLLRRFGPESLPRLQEVQLDGHVLAFTAAITTLTALLFGLAPAWLASSAASAAGLREDTRTGTGHRRHALGRALVVSETALSICLLVGAGLLVKSFYRTIKVSPGFTAHNVVSTEMILPKRSDQAHRLRLIEQTLEAMRALPGVEAAGGISEMPIHGEFNDVPFDIEEHPAHNPQERYDEDFRRITPGYFQAMQIPLLRGRLLNDNDQPSSLPVVVVDETFARRYFPGEDPIGKHIRRGKATEIVGVVGAVRSHTLPQAPQPTMYLPFAQEQSDNLHLVIRSSTDPSTLSDAVRRIVAAQDPDVALSSFETMDSFIAASLSGALFDTLLLGLFAGLALLLAMAGVYGVFSYIVAQQTHEIGVRIVLGAPRSQILRQVLARGARLAVTGVAVGLAAAFFLMKVLASQLYEVQPRDPFAFAFSAILLITVAVTACAVPARRAMKVDPIVALRCE
jgi:putative ABC transport system permease protein